eukprot:653083-Lingulodinium_polyedra.AAC.1
MVPDVAVGQELGPLRPVRRVTCREGGPSHVAKSQGPRHRNVNKQMPATPLKVQHHDVRPVVGGIEGSAIRILGPDVRVGENRPNHGEHHRQEDTAAHSYHKAARPEQEAAGQIAGAGAPPSSGWEPRRMGGPWEEHEGTPSPHSARKARTATHVPGR